MHHLACHQKCNHVIMSSKLETKLTTLDYSNFILININFLKTSMQYLDLPLYPKNSLENKISPMEILQNCVTLIGNFWVQNQDPSMKIYNFFL